MANQLNVAALLFMCNILPAYAASGNMPSIVLERPLFYRERDDGCYPVAAYVAHKAIEEGAIGLPRHARRTSHRVRGGGTPRVLSQVLARVLARATVGRRVGVRVRVARAEHGRREYPPPGVQHLSAALQRIADSTQGHRPRVGVVAAHAFRALRVASAADESFRKEPRTPAFVDSETGETVGVAAYYGADGLDGARTSDTSSCAGSVGSRSRASYSRKSDTGNGEYETMKRCATRRRR